MIEKNQNTEQVILQVTKDIFIEKGYAAGKTTEIAGGKQLLNGQFAMTQ